MGVRRWQAGRAGAGEDQRATATCGKLHGNSGLAGSEVWWLGFRQAVVG